MHVESASSPLPSRRDAPSSGANDAAAPTRPEPSVDGLADPVFAVDLDGVLKYANDTAAEVLGWNSVDLLDTSVLELIHPDDLNLAMVAMNTVTGKRFGELITLRVRTGRGTWCYLEIRGSYRREDLDDPLAGLVVIVARDVTDRHRLAFDQGDVAVLRAVMANMHGMVMLADDQGRVRSVNGAVTRHLGYDPELVQGHSVLESLHPDDRQQVIEAAGRLGPEESVTLDAHIRKADGDHLVCEFTITNLIHDPVVNSYVVTAQVSRGLTDARNRMEFLADHDRRTGLLNRDGFMRNAAEMMQSGGGLGILIIDIVHFRSINELYGEPVGDSVLAAVATRIDQIRWPDLVTARFGGDEFVLALKTSSVSVLEMLRERVRREMTRPLDVEGLEVNFDVRTAIAHEARPEVLDALLVRASNELMSAKRFADPDTSSISVDAINERRRQLEQLRHALNDGQIQPFFQPICTADGTITAVEALVRWVDPLRGVVGAGEILPLAQMAGLAEAVDDRVLDRALEFAVRLQEAGHPEIEVHVNIDPKLMARPSFANTFLDRCRRTGAVPTQLVVEITETDLLSPGAAALGNMQRLRTAGIHVSIDDFGTGYSSLAHLLELPVDGVKIDRRFVAGIDVDPAATNLTTAIVGLSESLRLTCVAEGVEQPYQRDRLAALGCSSFQGWLFAPAVAPDEMLALLPRIDIAPAAVPAAAPR